MSDIGRLQTRPRCWQCGTVVDGWTAVGAEDPKGVPHDGAVSVCLYCAALGMYVSSPYGLTIRRLTAAEGVDVEADEAAQTAVWAVRQWMRGRGPG